jgi:hypothetical protein
VVDDVESLGELNEWDEMAHPWTGHNGYVGWFLLGVLHNSRRGKTYSGFLERYIIYMLRLSEANKYI